MRNVKEIYLEEHPLTNTFQVMFDELAEYCSEILAIKKRLRITDRSSVEFYEMMARLDTLLMAVSSTAKHLRNESEKMDEMFEE